MRVDCLGKTCPKPLIEARKAMRDAEAGEEITIIGDHGPSKKEIPMAVELLGHQLLGVEDHADGTWTIRIRKR
jgi:tRNA 2-thiouridine synthesizing protein A